MAKEDLKYNGRALWTDHNGGSNIKHGDLEIAVIERKDGRWFMALAYGSDDQPERMSTLHHLVSTNCSEAKKEAIQIAASISISFGSEVESLIGRISGRTASASIPPNSTIACPACKKLTNPRMRDPISGTLWYVCGCGQKWKSNFKEVDVPKLAPYPEKRIENFEVSEGPHLDPRELNIGWKEMFDRIHRIEKSINSRIASISAKIGMSLKLSEMNNTDVFPTSKIISEDGTIIGEISVNESTEGLWVTAKIGS